MKDEWQLEMDRMLGIFERESELSLRKINRRFEVLNRPFNDEFRQYFMKRSQLRLETSFMKIRMERWDNSQVESSERTAHENISDCNTSASSSSGATTNVRLAEGDGIHLIVKSETVIEITDSDDEGDGIHAGRPNETQNGNPAEANASDTVNRNDDGESVSVDGCSMQMQMQMQSPIKLVEARISLDRCDSNRGKVGLTMRSGKGNSDEEVSNDLANVEGELKLNAPVKNESNALIKIERMDEMESIPMVTFDPNLETLQSVSAEPMANDSRTKRQSSSSPMAAHQSKWNGGKRFRCEHCDSSFHTMFYLKRHQRIHANGRLTGAKADSNGLYQCAHCVRQFTNVSNLSKHMKSHNENQHLYDCARCMRQFTEEAAKDRHESQCEGRHYQCHLCKVYVTPDKCQMRFHMRKHSGAKPFHCLLCGMNFGRKHHLRRHLNAVHSRYHS